MIHLVLNFNSAVLAGSKKLKAAACAAGASPARRVDVEAFAKHVAMFHEARKDVEQLCAYGGGGFLGLSKSLVANFHNFLEIFFEIPENVSNADENYKTVILAENVDSQKKKLTPVSVDPTLALVVVHERPAPPRRELQDLGWGEGIPLRALDPWTKRWRALSRLYRSRCFQSKYSQ